MKGPNDEQLNYVLSTYPDSSHDNTEFCLRFWETAAKQRGVDFPEELKQIIREYKPEALTRKRREKTESSPEQKAKAEEMREVYSLVQENFGIDNGQ